jgi:hypothetical protein
LHEALVVAATTIAMAAKIATGIMVSATVEPDGRVVKMSRGMAGKTCVTDWAVRHLKIWLDVSTFGRITSSNLLYRNNYRHTNQGQEQCGGNAHKPSNDSRNRRRSNCRPHP